MSNLMENKKIFLHIFSEVVVVAGMFYYFSAKFKILKNKMETLSKKIDDQNEVIEKLSQKNNDLILEMQQLRLLVENRYSTPLTQSPMKRVTFSKKLNTREDNKVENNSSKKQEPKSFPTNLTKNDLTQENNPMKDFQLPNILSSVSFFPIVQENLMNTKHASVEIIETDDEDEDDDKNIDSEIENELRELEMKENEENEEEKQDNVEKEDN